MSTTDGRLKGYDKQEVVLNAICLLFAAVFLFIALSNFRWAGDFLTIDSLFMTAVFGLLALGALTAFFILALDGALPNWAAALIVAAVYGAIAGVLALRGKERVQEAGKPVPEQTKESIEEDLRWARTQVKSGER